MSAWLQGPEACVSHQNAVLLSMNMGLSVFLSFFGSDTPRCDALSRANFPLPKLFLNSLHSTDGSMDVLIFTRVSLRPRSCNSLAHHCTLAAFPPRYSTMFGLP